MELLYGTDKMQESFLCQIAGILAVPNLITAETVNIIIILFCNIIQIFFFPFLFWI